MNVRWHRSVINLWLGLTFETIACPAYWLTNCAERARPDWETFSLVVREADGSRHSEGPIKGCRQTPQYDSAVKFGGFLEALSWFPVMLVSRTAVPLIIVVFPVQSAVTTRIFIMA